MLSTLLIFLLKAKEVTAMVIEIKVAQILQQTLAF